MQQAGALAEKLAPCPTLGALVQALPQPRKILLMVPSGAPVDESLATLRPLLAASDMVIDGGNSDFHDTIRRTADLAETGLDFVGMGVSGGEDGARHGPSMMVGGSDQSWQHLRPLLDAIAARFDGAPCVAHIGADGAGHFVKTVHNGIEYADMQMIAEIYGLMRDGAGWPSARIAAQFENWQAGPLSSFLIEATAQVLKATDAVTGLPMVDVILDQAGQKGTGRWTAIEALRLGQSATMIEAAVAARSWSAAKDTRLEAERLLPAGSVRRAHIVTPEQLAEALEAARILSHVQGFGVMSAAGGEYGWPLDLARIAEIWRAGCIIRSALLDDIADAFRAEASANLILAPNMRDRLAGLIPSLRQVVAQAVFAGLPVPALASALSYYDSIRRGRGTTNLTQAQRDFFGAHGFRRVDQDGTFHGSWSGWPRQLRLGERIHLSVDPDPRRINAVHVPFQIRHRRRDI